MIGIAVRRAPRRLPAAELSVYSINDVRRWVREMPAEDRMQLVDGNLDDLVCRLMHN